jgi:hypothetical protein
MSTFRDTVAWIVGLLGAVAVYDAGGALWLVAWTIGFMAFVHARHWTGTFPGEDDAFDTPSQAPPLHHRRDDLGCDSDREPRPDVRTDSASSSRRNHCNGQSQRCSATGDILHSGGGLSRQDSHDWTGQRAGFRAA